MWLKTEAIHNETEYQVVFKGNQYSFPASAGIAVGDTITIDGRSYQVTALSSFRDETLIAKVEEVKDDKPASRRARSKSSGEDVQSEGESGLDSSD